MPRQARIDAPGIAHHIICRGVDRCRIFKDNDDRDHFLSRLSALLTDCDARCYAWALIPNHFHLLLRTGTTPLTTIMRRLLTAYAIYFNRRHRRCAHLFQNRYKSVICQDEPYLLELVRYIHLTPLRARLVADLAGLERYRYSGHRQLLAADADWLDADFVLSLFAARPAEARRGYRTFIVEGLAGQDTPAGQGKDKTGKPRPQVQQAVDTNDFATREAAAAG